MTYVWIAVVLCTVIYLWPAKWPSFNPIDWIFKDHGNEQVDKNQAQVDSLRRVIKEYAAKQLEYDAQIDSLNDSIVVLKHRIEINNSKIAELKNKANEKANTVSNFNSSDILKFLSERYSDTTSVKRR